MLQFQVTQRGTVPVESVTQTIVDAQRRAVALLLSEVTKNVSGRVVQTRRGRLRAALESTIVARPGEVVGTVGFNKQLGYIARFLERGTKPHELGKGAARARRAFGRRRATRTRAPFRGSRSVILRFMVGSQVIFRRGAFHPGLPARPILASALEIATPAIRADFETSIGKALDG